MIIKRSTVGVIFIALFLTNQSTATWYLREKSFRWLEGGTALVTGGLVSAAVFDYEERKSLTHITKSLGKGIAVGAVVGGALEFVKRTAHLTIEQQLQLIQSTLDNIGNHYLCAEDRADTKAALILQLTECYPDVSLSHSIPEALREAALVKQIVEKAILQLNTIEQKAQRYEQYQERLAYIKLVANKQLKKVVTTNALLQKLLSHESPEAVYFNTRLAKAHTSNQTFVVRRATAKQITVAAAVLSFLWGVVDNGLKFNNKIKQNSFLLKWSSNRFPLNDLANQIANGLLASGLVTGLMTGASYCWEFTAETKFEHALNDLVKLTNHPLLVSDSGKDELYTYAITTYALPSPTTSLAAVVQELQSMEGQLLRAIEKIDAFRIATLQEPEKASEITAAMDRALFLYARLIVQKTNIQQLLTKEA